MSSLHNTDWPNISQSIRGMVFLATPFAGVENKSGLTTQGQVYEAIVAASFQIQDNALLTLAQDNDVLVSTVHEFTRKLSTSNPKPTLFCFYEQKATNIGAIVSKISTPVRIESCRTHECGLINAKTPGIRGQRIVCHLGHAQEGRSCS